jgi:hypothetical protein
VIPLVQPHATSAKPVAPHPASIWNVLELNSRTCGEHMERATKVFWSRRVICDCGPVAGIAIFRVVRWYAVLMSLIVAQGAYAMNSTAGGSREVLFYDAPYLVTITIPKSRDTFGLASITGGTFLGGHVIGGIGFTPPGGGPPNQGVGLRVYDRGKGKDESVPWPINPTLQEFVVEYEAHMAHFYPNRNKRLQMGQMGDVSAVRFGDRTWFKFKLIRTSTHSVQYWTPLDDRKMLVLHWDPPLKTFFNRSREAKKLPEIESMVASIRVSKEP